MRDTKLSILQTVIFWVLQLTWGIGLTLVGGIIAVILMIFGVKPHILKGCIYFEIGKDWDGIGLGAIFISAKGSSEEHKRYLVGHCLLNAIFGVFTILLVTIPYLMSLSLRKFKTYDKKRLFGLILFLVVEILAMTLCTLGFFYCIDLMHIMCCVIIYLIPLFMWFFAQELSRYQNLDNYKQYEANMLDKLAMKLGLWFCRTIPKRRRD